MKNGAAQRLAPKRSAPYPQPPLRSTLTLGAVEGRAPALDDSLDGSTAAAGLAFAIIDGEALREIAELSIGASEIAERRAARFDRLGEDIVNRGHQAIQSLNGNG